MKAEIETREKQKLEKEQQEAALKLKNDKAKEDLKKKQDAEAA